MHRLCSRNWSSHNEELLRIDPTTSELLGATGVNVGGALYDVDFLDGYCFTLFSGCDSESDFIFTTLATAAVASQALLDQVFVDGAEGRFDTDPTLTRGIGDFGFSARISTPYDLATPFRGRNSFFAASAVNSQTAGSDGDFVQVVGGRGGLLGSTIDFFDTKILENMVYAVWRFAPAEKATVPEPGSLLLLGTGGILLVASRRKASRGLSPFIAHPLSPPSHPAHGSSWQQPSFLCLRRGSRSSC